MKIFPVGHATKELNEEHYKKKYEMRLNDVGLFTKDNVSCNEQTCIFQTRFIKKFMMNTKRFD